MKKTLILLTLILSTIAFYAQDKGNGAQNIDSVMNICIKLRDAVAANDTMVIHQSAEEMKDLKLGVFNGLKCQDDTIYSLNGHLVFDNIFVDSLILNKDVFQRADEINRDTEVLRGQNPDGSISTKTCFVKAGENTKHTFRAKGYQELAVVAEAGGLVTMRIHVTNSAGLDERHDDTKDVVKGRPHRKTTFDLPENKSNTVELEVINCCNKDFSFVVISN